VTVFKYSLVLVLVFSSVSNTSLFSQARYIATPIADTRPNFFFQYTVEARPNGNEITFLKLFRNSTTTIEHNNGFKFDRILHSYSHLNQNDTEARDTLITLAKLAQDSYNRNSTYFNTSNDFSVVQGIGWDEIGVMGYIWLDNIKKNVIVAFKGTSINIPGSTLDILPTNSENRMHVFLFHII
jgi:hypothetical protein